MLSILITHTQKKDTKKLLEVMDISNTLIVMMVSWVYAYVQTHQIVYIKQVQVFLYQFYLNTVFFLIEV